MSREKRFQNQLLMITSRHPITTQKIVPWGSIVDEDKQRRMNFILKTTKRRLFFSDDWIFETISQTSRHCRTTFSSSKTSAFQDNNLNFVETLPKLSQSTIIILHPKPVSVKAHLPKIPFKLSRSNNQQIFHN